MTRFWWVRHGPTHVPRMVGWTDPPADLSDSARLGWLHRTLPDAPMIASDLLRARQTAAAIAQTRPRLPDAPGLREFHYGAWEDQDFDRIDSPQLRQFFDEPGHHRAPGGESWNDVAQRVAKVLRPLCDAHSDVILVAHMGTILTQWAQAKGITPYAALAQKIDNLSLTRIDWHRGAWAPVFANHQA